MSKLILSESQTLFQHQTLDPGRGYTSTEVSVEKAVTARLYLKVFPDDTGNLFSNQYLHFQVYAVNGEQRFPITQFSTIIRQSFPVTTTQITSGSNSVRVSNNREQLRIGHVIHIPSTYVGATSNEGDTATILKIDQQGGENIITLSNPVKNGYPPTHKLFYNTQLSTFDIECETVGNLQLFCDTSEYSKPVQVSAFLTTAEYQN